MSPRIDWDAIKQLPILKVAASVGIEVRGTNALCFGGHDKKTRSLHFSPDKNLWHCFGCGLGGSVIELVKQARGFSSNREAAIWIQNNFLPHRSTRTISTLSSRITPGLRPPSSTEITISHDNNSTFLPDPEVYEWILGRCPLLQQGTFYLQTERGFHSKTIQHFRIGELGNPNDFRQTLYARWPIERLLRCGILTERRDGEGYRVTWWQRVLLFPFIENGRVVYIQARRFDDGHPRYINLRGVQPPMFNSDCLRNAKKGSRVFICEGIPDTMTAHQLGFVSVGCLGANAFRDEWARLLTPFEIIAVPDGDSGGDRFIRGIRAHMRHSGRSVEKLKVPVGEDLSSAYKKGLLGSRSRLKGKYGSGRRNY